MTPQREIERDAYQHLVRLTNEMLAAGQVDRHSKEFKTKLGAVAEATEIWRSAEWAARWGRAVA